MDIETSSGHEGRMRKYCLCYIQTIYDNTAFNHFSFKISTTFIMILISITNSTSFYFYIFHNCQSYYSR